MQTSNRMECKCNSKSKYKCKKERGKLQCYCVKGVLLHVFQHPLGQRKEKHITTCSDHHPGDEAR